MTLSVSRVSRRRRRRRRRRPCKCAYRMSCYRSDQPSVSARDRRAETRQRWRRFALVPRRQPRQSRRRASRNRRDRHERGVRLDRSSDRSSDRTDTSAASETRVEHRRNLRKHVVRVRAVDVLADHAPDSPELARHRLRRLRKCARRLCSRHRVRFASIRARVRRDVPARASPGLRVRSPRRPGSPRSAPRHRSRMMPTSFARISAQCASRSRAVFAASFSHTSRRGAELRRSGASSRRASRSAPPLQAQRPVAPSSRGERGGDALQARAAARRLPPPAPGGTSARCRRARARSGAARRPARAPAPRATRG